ncbi:MAG: cytochrome c-550 [Gomphosphaeria aponina SAG 52.96 = DSM 107014]|uniref:Photosystem II extrinsic protein V n=1 Tax=Gomphosphaeria aponina SAG 52.96 = DSM 107014 TaxID=1521640 RepID=A0A941GU94_9CHRO|nr:cytochrome c-550 [Gomphosphaeria aponina SAG 52.96 = DSM 107014]
MLKRLIWVVVAAVFFAFQLNISSVGALELNEGARTVQLNGGGEEVIVSLQDVKEGQRLFVNACSYCHNGGRTKTNPNVTLGLADLAGAEPPRDNIVAIVDYLKNPKTYDGEDDISLFHPNTTRSDLYSEMRNLTDDDLEALAGYILVQSNVRGITWGKGKELN